MFATGRFKRAPWACRLVSGLIRLLTRSELCHCLIAYDGAVLEAGLHGVRYYPISRVLRRYPTLYGAFLVPFSYDIDLDYFRPLVGIRQPLVPRLVRWGKRGRGPWIYDCLCVVLACLKNGGVDVPETICTPVGLFQWLKSQGYEYVQVEGSAGGREEIRDSLTDKRPHPVP